MTIYLCVVLVTAVLFLVRNELTYRIVMRRIREIGEENGKRLRAYNWGNGLQGPELVEYDSLVDQYDKILYDLRGWSYDYFFPDGVK